MQLIKDITMCKDVQRNIYLAIIQVKTSTTPDVTTYVHTYMN